MHYVFLQLDEKIHKQQEAVAVLMVSETMSKMQLHIAKKQGELGVKRALGPALRSQLKKELTCLHAELDVVFYGVRAPVQVGCTAVVTMVGGSLYELQQWNQHSPSLQLLLLDPKGAHNQSNLHPLSSLILRCHLHSYCRH